MSSEDLCLDCKEQPQDPGGLGPTSLTMWSEQLRFFIKKDLEKRCQRCREKLYYGKYDVISYKTCEFAYNPNDLPEYEADGCTLGDDGLEDSAEFTRVMSYNYALIQHLSSSQEKLPKLFWLNNFNSSDTYRRCEDELQQVYSHCRGRVWYRDPGVTSRDPEFDEAEERFAKTVKTREVKYTIY